MKNICILPIIFSKIKQLPIRFHNFKNKFSNKIKLRLFDSGFFLTLKSFFDHIVPKVKYITYVLKNLNSHLHIF